MNMNLPFNAERDSEGYLLDPESWTPEIGQRLAQEENVDYSDAVLSIIEFMRAYWQEHQVAPDVRHVVEHLAQTDGIDKRVAKDLVFHAFPYGYVKQACKIAGMMRPRAWSTG